MNLLANGVSGGQGAFVWVGIECLDADYLQAISRSVREIGKVRAAVPFTRAQPNWLNVDPGADPAREITVDGWRVAVPPCSPSRSLRYHVWGTEHRAAVVLLTYDAGTAQTAKVSDGKGVTVQTGGGRLYCHERPGGGRRDRQCADTLSG